MSKVSPFGVLLQRYRRRAGLTQHALAECAKVSERAIVDHERGAKQAAHKPTAGKLAEALHLTEQEREGFMNAANRPRGGNVGPPIRRIVSPPHNLPTPPSPIIGRGPLARQAVDLLRQPDDRLVTLTGPGGVGKTRLALAIAEDLLDDFVGGIWFVDLAPVRDPGLIASAIAQSLGFREVAGKTLWEALRLYLRDERMLLVLDNFEHLTVAAPQVAKLLADSRAPKVLVTSRARLRIRGERVLEVPPLAIPDPAHLTAPALVENVAAVELFIARARAADPAFRLTENNAAAIGHLCRRLDGLPLAIELAAAHSDALALGSAQPPDGPLTLLTEGPVDLPARQSALRASLAWSYGLLSPPEQAMFRRFGVFTGGVTRDAAAAVCTAVDRSDGQPWKRLAVLIDHSLLRRSVRGPSRSTMLETVREFALEQLVAGGELTVTRQAHAAYFATMAERAIPALRGKHQADWLTRLETEHANLRTALDWLVTEGDAVLGLAMAGDLAEFWYRRGHLTEGRTWLAKARAKSDRASARTRARAHEGAGLLAFAQGDLPAARTELETGLQIARADDETKDIAACLDLLGNVEEAQGDHDRARERHQESLALAEGLQDHQRITTALNNLGNVALSRADITGAAHFYARSLHLDQELGNDDGIAVSLNNLGQVACFRGDYAEAKRHYEESLAISHRLKNKVNQLVSFNGLGIVAMGQDDVVGSRQHHEVSLALARELKNDEAIVVSLFGLGNLAAAQGDGSVAKRRYEESLALARKLGNAMVEAASLHGLGRVAFDGGDRAGAIAFQQQSLAIFRKVGDVQGIACCCDELAGLCAPHEADRAARLLGAVERLREEIGAPMAPDEQKRHDGYLAAVRRQLGGTKLADGRDIGRGQTVTDIVGDAYAVAS